MLLIHCRIQQQEDIFFFLSETQQDKIQSENYCPRKIWTNCFLKMKSMSRDRSFKDLTGEKIQMQSRFR